MTGNSTSKTRQGRRGMSGLGPSPDLNHPTGMDLSKMTRQEIEIMRLLTEFERDKVALLMRKRREVEAQQQLNLRPDDLAQHLRAGHP